MVVVISMGHYKLLLGTGLLTLVAALSAMGMAGEMKSPSLAMPSGTPPDLHSNLLSALSEKDCRFLDGHFINASTTLRYGGSAESLSRLINRLTNCQGIRVVVSFVREDPGLSWTVRHNGWADASNIYVQVNQDSSALDLKQLQLTISGPSFEPRK